MASSIEAVIAPTTTLPATRRGWRSSPLVEVLRSPVGALGVAIVVVHLLLALAAPVIAPYNVLEQSSTARLQGPSPAHLFGTDRLGRDVLSRTIAGGRVALAITLAGAALAIAWGSAAGLILGLTGGKLDEGIMRIVDALLAIPWILFLLLIIAIMGSAPLTLVVILAFFYGLPVIRIVRGATLDIVARDYVTAAQLRGESRASILRRELLPNTLDIILVEGAMQWSWMLLGFSSLSFLGFGVAPPTPDWGVMINDNRTTLGIAPWATLFPLVALSSLIIGINLAADAVAKRLGIDRTQGAPL